MRRESQYPITGFAAGACIVGIIDLVLQYLELNEHDKPYWDTVDWARVARRAAVGGVAGAVIGHLWYEQQLSREAKELFDANDYLNDVIRRSNIKVDVEVYEYAMQCRRDLKRFIVDKFGDKLAGSPRDWGSFAHCTAVKVKSDYDIISPFRRDSFSSLEAMFETHHEAFYEKYHRTTATVRKQNKSVGITFPVGETEVHFDVVPGREINCYRLDGELNLYDAGSFWKDPSRVKTNVFAQGELTRNRPEERKIIKLMKIYLLENGLKLKSTMLQVLVTKAFDYYPPSTSVTQNFLYIMKYLATNLPHSRVTAPGNSHRVLSDQLSQSEVTAIVNTITSDLKAISRSKRYLKEIFQ